MTVSGPPTASTNQSFTNASSLYIATGGVSSPGTVTNSYGLNVNAATGATNNYAAIFNGGNVGIGTTSPGALLSVNGAATITTANLTTVNLQSASVNVGSLNNRTLSLYDYTGSASTNPSQVIIKTGRLGGPVSSGDSIGNIFFQGNYSGFTATSAALINATADGTVSATSMPGRLAFSTTPVGSLTLSERMRIDSSGYVGIGTTGAGARLDVYDTSTTTSAIIVPRAATFTGTTANGMIRYSTTSNLFEFYQNGAWVNYTSVSDGRLKTNVEKVDKGLEIVNQLNPVFFDWDQSNERTRSFNQKHQVGFIAQEVEKVLPEVVDKGQDSYRSVEYGKIVAVVVAAVKELYAKVLGVESSVSELKAENAAKDREIASIRAQLENEKSIRDQKIKTLEQRLERIEKALPRK